ncbi:MAG: type IV toxin-antitoxin system AbiEi family antitoxin domain-containing protein [Corynebacterium casei]|nr:hypothetical protein [Corynebacterium casei]
MNEALEIAADLASQQWGLVTSAQARSLGVAAFQMSRLVDRGAFVRIRSSPPEWCFCLSLKQAV